MFKTSKYTKWYFNIIENAKFRNNIGYTENHHIIPKSLSGSNKKENMIKLTAREHYIVHLLLMKMCIKKDHTRKMVAAYVYMSKVRNKHTKERYNSNLYEYHKKIRATFLSETMKGSGNPMFGKTHNNETRNLISNARKGVNTNTEESRNKKRENWLNNNPNYNPISNQKRIDAKSFVWKIIDPKGNIYIIKNRNKFCRENNLSQGNLASGKSKGWSCHRIYDN